MADMTYEHEELVKAVDRLKGIGEFSTRVEASRKAGVILNNALDEFGRTINEGVIDELKNSSEKEELEGNLGSIG